jgi:O-antigen ligase
MGIIVNFTPGAGKTASTSQGVPGSFSARITWEGYPRMMNRSQTAVSLERVLQRTALLFLALYLVIMGGKFSGLILYLPYQINVLLITLGGAAWILWRALRRRPFPATSFDLPLLIFLAVFLLASLASEDPRLSMEQFVYYLVCVLIFYLMVDLERAGKPVETWVGLTLVGGVWFLAFGLAELIEWWLRWLEIGGIAQPIPPATIRVQATIGHANVLAAYLNMLWPLAAARLVAARSRWLKVLLGLYVVAAFVLIFFTSSRGGWLGSATALAVLILLLAIDRRAQMQRAWDWLRKRAWALIGLALVGVSVLGLGGALLLRQSQHPSHPEGNPRSYIWNVAIEMFRERPLLGTGPGTYVSHFLQTYSIPPGTLLPHAHNILINQLGENGLPGALITAVLGVVLGWTGWKRWHGGMAGQRTLLAGSLAVLAGLAVHSQFELAQTTPLVNILTAGVIAQLAAPLEPRPTRAPVLGKVLLTAGWLSAAGLGLFSQWGYAAYQHGLDALRLGDEPTAVEWMEKATQRDPGTAFYWLRSGEAYARVGLDGQGQVQDTTALAKAISAKQRGLAIQGSFAPDWVSLAKLQRAAGDRAGQLAALQRAADLADEWIEVKLMLGEAVSPAPAKDARDGWQALEAGEFAHAEVLFRAQLGVNDTIAYLGLGLALQGQGRLGEAETALRTSEFIDDGQARVHEALAGLYGEMGDQAGAAEEAERAKELLSSEGQPSDMMSGESSGDWYIIYHRE